MVDWLGWRYESENDFGLFTRELSQKFSQKSIHIIFIYVNFAFAVVKIAPK